MIQEFKIEWFTHEYTQVAITSTDSLNGFPLLSIDSESYVDGREIQSGVNFLPFDGCHCIAIGKSCSPATGIVFMIDLNHDYTAVFQGVLPCITSTRQYMKAPRKGSIIIQNDVWVGYGVNDHGRRYASQWLCSGGWRSGGQRRSALCYCRR